MNTLRFTPEDGIDFVFVIDPIEGTCREVNGKMAVFHERTDAISNELVGIVIRMEDPSHPGKCWIFNSWKELEDNVPFRKFQYIDGKLIGFGYHGDYHVMTNFVDTYREVRKAHGKVKTQKLAGEWSVTLEKWQIYCIEYEMLESETRYECPYGKNYE
jgi:hypothetical protein